MEKIEMIMTTQPKEIPAETAANKLRAAWKEGKRPEGMKVKRIPRGQGLRHQ